jgi:hypothetical protein
MPDEGIAVGPPGKPMNTRILVPVNWTLWGILLAVLLYGLVQVSTERTSSPEAGRGLGIFAVVFLLVLLAGVGFLLNVAARKQSTKGLITLTVILAWPLLSIVADPAIKAYKGRKFADDEARVGDFKDATLASMARAIAANDSATLVQLLGGKRPPEGTDRAGNDLLAYAIVVARDKRVGSGPVRALLAAGADPNVVDPRSGNTPLGEISDDVEMVRAFVDNGADIDRIQSDGTPAVVRFIGTRQWDSALYLIEKGARLDVVNQHGLSVDYYLNDWNESVFGEHPEGWDRVREAIAKRRAAPNE